MPERSAYDEAILLPQVRLRVQDEELTQGQVEKFQVRMAVGSIERPWGLEGGFAVVYKYRTRSGTTRALRCFRVPINPDVQFRYERIGIYFATHAPTITAHFTYHNQGITVKEQVYGQLQSNVYPVIEMEWIEGQTLIEHVDTLCQNRDRAGLARLVERWLDMLRITRKAKISHGDLAGGNVMVRADGRLVLIDYDGVYIPEFTSLEPIVLGQMDYQHPDMAQRPFNEYTDDFSALVIYAALLVLGEQPELWEQHVLRSPNGKLLSTHLLFNSQDFIDPDRSQLLQSLAQHKNARVASTVQTLKQACKQPVDIVQFPWHLAEDERKRALGELTTALNTNDDEQIVTAWVSVLDGYGPAQIHRPRVEQAQLNVQALVRLREALLTHNIQQVVAKYDPRLDQSSSVSAIERDLVSLALSFHQACQNGDEQTIVAAWEDMQNLAYKDSFQLTLQEQQQIAQAQQRKAVLARFRIALFHGHITQLIAAYTPELENCKGFTDDEQTLLLDARAFMQAYQSNDDDALLVASQQLRSGVYSERIAFTAEEQQRLTLTRQRKVALNRLRSAIRQKNAQNIMRAYGSVLNGYSAVTTEERTLLNQIRNFLQAYRRDNDEDLYATSTKLQGCIQFTPQEQQRIALAEQHTTLLRRLRNALSSQEVQLIAASYDPLLSEYKTISKDEYEQAELAHTFWEAWQADDDRAIVAAWEAIIHGPQKRAFTFTDQEKQRITLAQQRIAALVKFRLAIVQKQIQQIVLAYDPILNDCKNVMAEEHLQFQLANALIQAQQANNDQQIITAWQAIKASPYSKHFVLPEQIRQRIKEAETSGMRQGEPPHA